MSFFGSLRNIWDYLNFLIHSYMNNFISHIYTFILLYCFLNFNYILRSSFIDLCFMNRESRSENEEARKASKLLLYDQNVFIGMINSRNYHFGPQKKESMLIIFLSSVEELSTTYEKFYHTIQNFIYYWLCNEVSLQFKNKTYIFEFLVCVDTILHLKLEFSTFLHGS